MLKTSAIHNNEDEENNDALDLAEDMLDFLRASKGCHITIEQLRQYGIIYISPEPIIFIDKRKLARHVVHLFRDNIIRFRVVVYPGKMRGTKSLRRITHYDVYLYQSGWERELKYNHPDKSLKGWHRHVFFVMGRDHSALDL